MKQPTLFLTVGLPGTGKTTAARRIEVQRRALRLTKDEWVKALYGRDNPAAASDVIEGRLIQIGMRALELGTNVIIDFGLWSRDERAALRQAAADVDQACRSRHQFSCEPAAGSHTHRFRLFVDRSSQYHRRRLMGTRVGLFAGRRSRTPVRGRCQLVIAQWAAQTDEKEFLFDLGDEMTEFQYTVSDGVGSLLRKARAASGATHTRAHRTRRCAERGAARARANRASAGQRGSEGRGALRIRPSMSTFGLGRRD